MVSSEAVKYDGLDANCGSASLHSAIDYLKLGEYNRENVSSFPLILYSLARPCVIAVFAQLKIASLRARGYAKKARNYFVLGTGCLYGPEQGM